MARPSPRASSVSSSRRIVALDADSDDDAGVQEVGGEEPRLARPDDDATRPVVHQRPDLAEVARGGEPALRHHEHVRSEALDLVEHVARDDDAAAVAAEAVEELDHVRALARIEPGERLVEHDQPRVVDDRLRELDPLAHALRVGRQPPLVVGVELDGRERGAGRAVGIGKAVAGRPTGARTRAR